MVDRLPGVGVISISASRLDRDWLKVELRNPSLTSQRSGKGIPKGGVL